MSVCVYSRCVSWGSPSCGAAAAILLAEWPPLVLKRWGEACAAASEPLHIRCSTVPVCKYVQNQGNRTRCRAAVPRHVQYDASVLLVVRLLRLSVRAG